MAASTTPLKLAIVACVLLFVGLGIYLAPLHPSVVALQLTYAPVTFGQVLAAWGPEGVQRFRNHLPVDGLLLWSYGAAGYWAVARTRFLDRLLAPAALRWVAFLLPAAALCDAGENLLHWQLTTQEAMSAPVAPAWYLAAGLCATLKWLGIAGFAMVTLLARLRR